MFFRRGLLSKKELRDGKGSTERKKENKGEKKKGYIGKEC